MIYLALAVLLPVGFLALLYHFAPEMYAALVRGSRAAAGDFLRFVANKLDPKT